MDTVVPVAIIIGAVYGIKKLEKEIELLGLSKNEVKIIIGIILLFFLYKNYNKAILKTNVIASDVRIGLIKADI